MNPNVRKLCLRRVLCSSFCNLVLQSLMIAGFLFVVNANLLHPLTWSRDWIGCMFCWKTWLYVFPLFAVIVAQGLVCSKDYTSLQPFYPTRFSTFIQILSFDNVMIMLLHLFIGYLIPWLYLSMSGGQLSSFKINSRLNEERLFLIFGGVWINLLYFVKTHFAGVKHMIFPVIQQPKFALIKSELGPIIRSTVPEVFLPNCLYLVIFYFKGGVLRDLGCQLFDLEPYDGSIDSIGGLVDIRRLTYLWSITIVVVSTMKLMEFLFRIYLTEREIFPFNNLFLNSGSLTLNEALNVEFPFIKHLAFFDLFKLSENSKERRAHIFSLSQPGGHPHVWNSIKEDCFGTIETFITSLTGLLIFRQTKEKQEETYNRYGVPLTNSMGPTEQMAPKKATVLELIFSKVIQNFSELKFWVDSKLSWWYNLPIVVYLFGDRKDLKIKYALKQAQPVLWASHTLSHLAVHSISEDNFGIVQNDLDKIICVLLKLKQTLESVDRHVAIPAVDPCASSRATRLANRQTITAHGLVKSINRSIYRISDAFRSYIPDLHLPRDAEVQMRSFTDYKV